MSVDEPTRDGWQVTAILLGIVAAFLLGLVLLGIGFAIQATAEQFQAAPACASTAAVSSGCYRLEPVTITNDDHRYYGTRTHDYLTLRSRTGSVSRADVVNGDESVLQVGAQARAKVYNETITDVLVSGQDMETEDNPLQKEGQTLLWGLLLTVISGFMLWGIVATRRSRRRSRIRT